MVGGQGAEGEAIMFLLVYANVMWGRVKWMSCRYAPDIWWTPGYLTENGSWHIAGPDQYWSMHQEHHYFREVE